MMGQDFKTIPWDEVPDSWRDRCSRDGHDIYIDENGDRRYIDNSVKLEDSDYRACAKCNEFPNENGDDYCIKSLGNVMNACCGHGSTKGYVQFDNGITIRGFFDIEYSKPFTGVLHSIKKET